MRVSLLSVGGVSCGILVGLPLGLAFQVGCNSKKPTNSPASAPSYPFPRLVPLRQTNNDDKNDKNGGSKVEEYRNLATIVLSNFMSGNNQGDTDVKEMAEEDPLAFIDFDVPKLAKKLDLETLAEALDYELVQKEWFVTGNVNPVYFADSFRFQDPDVKLDGIENYARGVNTLFDQSCSRAEILSTKVNPELGPNMITCTWRLSGFVRIGPGLKIKPYIVYTDFAVVLSRVWSSFKRIALMCHHGTFC